MPIDPSLAVSGAEWQITPPQANDATTPTDGSGFGSMLSSSIKSLGDSQVEASSAAQALATGQASDPTSVVMAVERAQLAMQLAGQIRTKAVEAAQDIFHTQV
jgi:flagellar hook-basal body complex protein FliE